MSKYTLDNVVPRVLPAGWTSRKVQIGPIEAIMVENLVTGLRVLVSVDPVQPGQQWLHVSASRANRLPSWEDLHEVKNLLIGREKTTVQLLPKESDYVNFNKYTLHLWHRLDGPTTTGPWE